MKEMNSFFMQGIMDLPQQRGISLIDTWTPIWCTNCSSAS